MGLVLLITQQRKPTSTCGRLVMIMVPRPKQYQDSQSNGSPLGQWSPRIVALWHHAELGFDSNYEYGYISAAIMRLTSTPMEMWIRYTSLYQLHIDQFLKVVLESVRSQIQDLLGCTKPVWIQQTSVTWLEFYDPVDDGNLVGRPEVYYSATTSWHSDGSLGVYWELEHHTSEQLNKGYFFAVKDSAQ